MFRGRYEHAIDGKGRTSLPARFRDVLAGTGDPRVVVTTGLEPCLVAYPIAEWTQFEERLAKLPQFDVQVAMLRRIFVSGAVDCEIDKLGRLLIPQTLRKHAGLTRELMWAGMGSHIELWDKQRFESRCNEVLLDPEKLQALAARAAELGL